MKVVGNGGFLTDTVGEGFPVTKVELVTLQIARR